MLASSRWARATTHLAAAPLRRRWAVAPGGTVPTSELDALVEEHRQKELAKAASVGRAPQTYVPPAIARSASVADDDDLRGPSAEPRRDLDVSESPHLTDDVAEDATSDAPAEGQLQNRLKRRLERTVDDRNAALRELQRRSAATDLTTLSAERLAKMSMESVEAQPSPELRIQLANRRIKGDKPNAELALRGNMSQGLASPLRSLSTTATALVPQTRYDQEHFDEPNAVAHRRASDAVVASELEAEKLRLRPSDATRRWRFEDMARRSTLRINSKHPVNMSITAPYVVVQAIQDTTSGELVHFPTSIPEDLMTVGDARKLAEEHGLDLVQRDMTTSSDVRQTAHARCWIMDGASLHMDMLAEEIGIKPLTAPALETLEVGFTGKIQPHSVKAKVTYVSKFLYRRHFMRIVLTQFGTPREGFPVFESILSEIRKGADRINAPFVCGKVQYEPNRIWCVLSPTSAKVPLTSSTTPTQDEMLEELNNASYREQYNRERGYALDETLKGSERFDALYADGTSWTVGTPGLTLRQLRKLKLHQGWMPKGNNELYRARGDVNVRQFRRQFSGGGGRDEVEAPRESNLEQANRGAGALRARAQMDISTMYDENETEGHTHIAARTHYQASGDNLAVGRLKEELGLKRNRLKLPRKAAGFATLGVKEPDMLKAASEPY